jgi:hypothetical protein
LEEPIHAAQLVTAIWCCEFRLGIFLVMKQC